MHYESDEECTADYGPFGDHACKCSGCNPRPRQLSDYECKAIERDRQRRENERRVGSEFNRYMIDLYNARRP